MEGEEAGSVCPLGHGIGGAPSKTARKGARMCVRIDVSRSRLNGLV